MVLFRYVAAAAAAAAPTRINFKEKGASGDGRKVCTKFVVCMVISLRTKRKGAVLVVKAVYRVFPSVCSFLIFLRLGRYI